MRAGFVGFGRSRSLVSASSRRYRRAIVLTEGSQRALSRVGPASGSAAEVGCPEGTEH